MAEQYGVDLLAELPLDIRIREQADGGRPTVVAEPDSALGRAYIDLARRTAARLARTALDIRRRLSDDHDGRHLSRARRATIARSSRPSHFPTHS